MVTDIKHDRLTQLVIKHDDSIGIDTARARLENAALVLYTDSAANSSWGQAAILTIAECAVRMFRGGVYLGSEFAEPAIIGNKTFITLRQMLVDAGCKTVTSPANAKALHVGIEANAPMGALRCWADGWVAITSPNSPSELPLNGNEISGILAGAMAVSEIFRQLVLGDVCACKRTQKLSPLSPMNPMPVGIGLELLPKCCWILGLGNLGQATMWVLGLLPYSNPAEVELVLQDSDICGPENLDIQILTKHAWLGHKKARMVAAWAEERGFQTIINERRFTDETKRTKMEPNLAFVGVDNLPTRRLATKAGFDLLIDAGLGASAGEIFDVSIHSFPSEQKAEKIWADPVQQISKPLNASLEQHVKEGRLDACGAMIIDGQSVGVPSTAVVAATIQVAQACLAIAQGKYCDLIDLSLVSLRNTYTNEISLERVGVIQGAIGYIVPKVLQVQKVDAA